MGNDLHMDYSAVGQTVHLAARMEQLAAPGRVFLTATALRLVEGLVQVNALGPMLVKGLSEPVEVYERVGASGIGRCLQAAVARGLPRFVGRDCYRASIWCGMGAVWRRTVCGAARSRQRYVSGAWKSPRPAAPHWSWARLLKRVFALDMATCPSCHRGALGGMEDVLPRCRAKGRRQRPFKIPMHGSRPEHTLPKGCMPDGAVAK
jgi:Adenylate and Guanylate cyclase catalytic domain